MTTPLTKEQAIHVLEYHGLSVKFVDLWKIKYKGLRVHSSQRGIGFSLTFKQYTGLAVKAGLNSPKQIGKTRGKYQMSRFGDSGDYEKGNCRFITIEENQREKILNGGFERGASKVRGRTKETHSGVARTAAKRTGCRKETHQFLADMALKKSKKFRLVSPRGKIVRGQNLNEFCSKSGMSRSSLSKVCRGERADYYGWTGKYL